MKTPAYLTLYTNLRDQIIAGTYVQGAKLPSKRAMAEETGLSLITVEHAYDLLCAEGYVSSRERSGYYVAFHRDDGFVPPVSPHPMPPSPSPGPAPDFPLSVLSRTMRRVLNDRGAEALSRCENQGALPLRNALAEYLARSRNIKAQPEQIIIGAGAEYLYNLIVGLPEAGSRFAIESPSYHRIEQVYRTAGVELTKLPLAADGIDSFALKNCSADLLHVTPYRSFPSGVTASASKRHEYLRWAAEKNRLLVEDDYESEFSLRRRHEETLFSLSEQENVIYMNTFSKTISPGIRVGYMVLPPALLGRYQKKLGSFSCPVPTYIQLVVSELIVSGDFERHIHRVRRQKRREAEETI